MVTEVYQGVPAPRLRKVGDGSGAAPAGGELPKSMQIRDDDDEARAPPSHAPCCRALLLSRQATPCDGE